MDDATCFSLSPLIRSAGLAGKRIVELHQALNPLQNFVFCRRSVVFARLKNAETISAADSFERKPVFVKLQYRIGKNAANALSFYASQKILIGEFRSMRKIYVRAIGNIVKKAVQKTFFLCVKIRQLKPVRDDYKDSFPVSMTAAVTTAALDGKYDRKKRFSLLRFAR